MPIVKITRAGGRGTRTPDVQVRYSLSGRFDVETDLVINETTLIPLIPHLPWYLTPSRSKERDLKCIVVFRKNAVSYMHWWFWLWNGETWIKTIWEQLPIQDKRTAFERFRRNKYGNRCKWVPWSEDFETMMVLKEL